MKIRRITLRNWRGAQETELSLGDGVTVVEGPNEIGKSSVLEAIGLLFSELDSSRKRTIQAVKPVDRDVGSEICAEIEAGDWHFIYRKIYNRSPATELKILKPEPKQLTGRDAHEKAEQLLQESMDMSLWKALMMPQGEGVDAATKVALSSSDSLLKALDDAAGSAGEGDENPDLFSAVQAEYERYYTPKNHQPRFRAEIDAWDNARQQLEAAQQAIDDIQHSVDEREQCAEELKRLQHQLPDQQAECTELEKQWQSISSLQQTLTNQQQLSEAARKLHQELSLQVAERSRQAQQVADLIGELQQTTDAEAAPGLTAAQTRVETLAQRVNQVADEAKAVSAAVKQAEADQRHLAESAWLENAQTRLKQLAEIDTALEAAAHTVAAIAVTETLLMTWRKTDRVLAVQQTQLTTAATQLSIEALADIDVTMNDAPLPLASSEIHEQSVAEPLQLDIHQLARISLTPPANARQLQDQLDASLQQLEDLKRQSGVESLAEAEDAWQRRATAEANIERLKDRAQTLLAGEDLTELKQQVEATARRQDQFQQQRDTSVPMPENIDSANRLVALKQQDQARLTASLDGLRSELDKARESLLKERQEAQDTQQRRALKQALLNSQQSQLKSARDSESDEALQRRASDAEAELTRQRKQVQELERELASGAAASLKSRRDNALQVVDQSRAQVARQEQHLAVLDDRLQQARADGRYQHLETAQRACQHQEEQVMGLRRRAAAAKLLWSTLNRCRETSRKAYVEPLKQALERLGTIVFGDSFGVTVDDHLSISERTLNGITLPESELSSGAREQMALLTRLAAAQIVAPGGGVPLFIDDALGFSDPQRLKTLGAAISAAGKDCQIVILTCTPGRFQNIGGAHFLQLG